jgi:hypothetical protein
MVVYRPASRSNLPRFTGPARDDDGRTIPVVTARARWAEGGSRVPPRRRWRAEHRAQESTGTGSLNIEGTLRSGGRSIVGQGQLPVLARPLAVPAPLQALGGRAVRSCR